MAEGSRIKRGVFAWVLFIALMILLFVLFAKSKPRHPEIPLGDFVRLLKANEVRWVDVGKDTLIGEFQRDEKIGDRLIQQFQVNLPEGTTSNWTFTNWLLNNAEGANIGTDSSAGNNVLLNIITPLIPWVLIFAFIWFFVFRQLRKQAGNQKEQPPVKVYVVNQPGGENVPLATEVQTEVKQP